jgi:hypothetical protein
MKKMSLNKNLHLIKNFQILINTNNFLLYNNPRINEFLLWKNQKYSSEEQKIYIIPIEKQNKLILKQKQFRILFLNYKYKYYYLFIYKLFSKYIRKKFIYDILSITKNCFILYILDNIWNPNNKLLKVILS